MKKLSSIIIMLAILLTLGVNVFYQSRTKNIIKAEEQNNELINYFDYTDLYVDRTTSYTSSDGKFPEYYSLIEGNATAKKNTSKSESYNSYMIYPENQASNGLCWAFSASKVLETTITKKTGESIDFSEAWLSLCMTMATSEEGKVDQIFDIWDTKFVSGGGGNFYLYDYLARNYGLVLEQDYNYHNSYLVSQDQTKDDGTYYSSNANYLYDFYSQGASNDYLENYITVQFKVTNPAYVNSVKKHIMKNGAVNFSTVMAAYEFDEYFTMTTDGVESFFNSDSKSNYRYSKNAGDENKLNEEWGIKMPDAYKIVKEKFPSYSASQLEQYIGRHAMAIIGWDDTYVNAEGEKGAWILLNSWGANYTFMYLEYGDTDLLEQTVNLQGYEYNEKLYDEIFDKLFDDEDEINYEDTITSSNAIGIKTSSGLQTDQKNIFYQNNALPQLTYQYKMTSGANIDLIEVYLDGEDITEMFNISKTSSTIKVSFKSQYRERLKCGSYKIQITYSKNGKSKVHNNTLLITNGFDFFGYYKGSKYNSSISYFNTRYDINKPIEFQVSDLTGTIEITGSYYIYSTNMQSNVADNPDFTRSYYYSLYPEGVVLTYDLGTEKRKDYTYELVSGDFSQEITVRVILTEETNNVVWVNYQTNGGGTLNLDTIVPVNSDDSLYKLENPTKEGYEFVGWYYDKNLTEELESKNDGFWYFNTDKINIAGNNKRNIYYQGARDFIKSLNVYAKWILQAPKDLALNTNKNWNEIGSISTINLTYTHDFINRSGMSILINWFEEGQTEPFETTTIPKVTVTNNSSGIKKYRAELYLSYRGELSAMAYSEISIYVIDPVPLINNIFYNGEGEFNWVDNSISVEYFGILYNANYKVNLYKQNRGVDSKVSEHQVNYDGTNNKNINFINNLQSSGKYRIGIIKNVGEASTEEMYSDYIDIVSVSYVCDTTECELPQKQLLDINSTINQPKQLIKTGYTFEGWHLSEKLEDNTLRFPLTITNSGDTVLYAKWSLNPFSYTTEGNLDGITYDDNNHQFTVNATHELNNLTFSYEWLKNGTSLKTTKENVYNVSSVSENGNYVCVVTASDSKKRQVNTSVEFIVNILKAQSNLNVNNVVTELTYNASQQVIKSGAEIENFKNRRTEDQVDIVYSNNKFKDVPLEGYIDVVITVPESVNYLGTQETVRVIINKAKSTLYVQDQDFTYNGERVIPVGEISNEEQLLKFEGEDIINVGTYTRKVIAYGSQNYYDIEDEITIEVKPAVIQIKAKNVTSPWLLGKQELNYEVVKGQLFGEDDLKIKLACNANTSSPGKYKISVVGDNDNYYIGTIEGVYTVTVIPHIIVLLTIILIAIYFVIRHFMKGFSIEFEGTGKRVYAPIETKKRKDIRLKTPIREGYAFKGWYVDEELTKPFSGNIKRGKNLILYAKWAELENYEVETSLDTNEVKNFVDNLFNNNIQENNIEKSLDSTDKKVEVGTTIVTSKNVDMDFINNIINKATTENSTNGVNNVENIQEFIDKISKN